MPIEHLLEERGAAARHAHDERDALHRRRTWLEPARAAAHEVKLLLGVGDHPVDVEGGSCGGVQVERQVERAAVLAVGIQEADGIEARDPAHQGGAVAAGKLLEAGDGARAVGVKADAGGEDRGAWVLRPIPTFRHQRLQLIAAVGAVQHLGERQHRVRRVGSALAHQHPEAIDGRRTAPKAVVDDGAQELHFVAGAAEPQGAVDRLVCLPEPSQAEGSAGQREPRRGVAGVLGNDVIGQSEGGAKLPPAEQLLQFGLGVASGHGSFALYWMNLRAKSCAPSLSWHCWRILSPEDMEKGGQGRPSSASVLLSVRFPQMKTFIASGIAAASLVSFASADVTVTFTNQTWTGFSFTDLTAQFGGFTGTLTGVSVDATLNAATNETYADDLCVYVDPAPLSTGGLLQVGGFSNLNATQRLSWANGGSSAPGTTVIDATSVNAIVFSGSPTDPIIWLGNGYGFSGTSGTWTGTITLIGVNAVPAPGALALLGVAGFAARRRRA